jgi:hypothetical protein
LRDRYVTPRNEDIVEKLQVFTQALFSLSLLFAGRGLGYAPPPTSPRKERGEVARNYPTNPFIPFTGALSGNTLSASTRSPSPR